MSAQLIQLALSNLAASAVLGAAAYLVHRHGRYPGLAHLLWVLVLLKLVTPPLLTLPLLPLPADGAVGVVAGTSVSGDPALAATGLGTTLARHLAGGVILAWLLGSLVVLTVSLVRIHRFDRMLRRTSSPAPSTVEAIAREIGSRFGMRRIPTVVTTSAQLSPMTWWTGRRVLVVIPEVLVEQLTTAQLRWVLAHELAHVKRRDHLVRWLEWLACVSFWWNPVAWWARRNLHHDEEASCDAFVLRHLDRQPRSYASALLTVVEVLARVAVRPPAVATGIDGGALERRFGLIMAPEPIRSAPRSLTIVVLSLALVLMPLGMGAAGPDDAAGPADAAEPVTGGAAAQGSAGSADEPEYRMLSAALRPADAIPAATEAGARATPEVRRAERRLRIAERKLRTVERALDRDGASKQSRRRLKDARQAVQKAERAVERAEGVPRAVVRDLREVRRSLRQATRELRAAKAGG